MNLLHKLSEKIGKSMTDHLGKVSAGTISSYFILAQIMLLGLFYLGVDVVNGIIMWRKNEIYALPNQSIFVFGLILSHHLVLLGIKKSGDTAMYPSVFKQTEEKTVNGETTKREVQIGAQEQTPAAPVAAPESPAPVDVDVDVAVQPECTCGAQKPVADDEPTCPACQARTNGES